MWFCVRSVSDRFAEHLALALTPEVDGHLQRLVVAVFVDREKFAFCLSAFRRPRGDVLSVLLVHALNSGEASRAGRGEHAIGARLADDLLRFVAPLQRFLERFALSAVRQVGEVFRERLTHERHARVPAHAVLSRIVDAEHTFDFCF
jgi:hypothetical protein